MASDMRFLNSSGLSFGPGPEEEEAEDGNEEVDEEPEREAAAGTCSEKGKRKKGNDYYWSWKNNPRLENVVRSLLSCISSKMKPKRTCEYNNFL